jgi:hypothetical protein
MLLLDVGRDLLTGTGAEITDVSLHTMTLGGPWGIRSVVEESLGLLAEEGLDTVVLWRGGESCLVCGPGLGMVL